MNTHVNFETAKLLKEKGFNERSEPYRYSNTGELTLLEGLNAPTIAEVVMGLYEKYGIWISVSHQRHSEGKHWKYNIKQANGIETILWRHNSPTEAYEAAIEYTLNNLI